MATIKQTLATSTSITIFPASVTNGNGRASTAIDNSSNLYLSADVYLKLKSGASSTSATGYVDIYLIRSEDGTTYDDNFGGSDAAYTPANATLLGRMAMVANATTYYMVVNTEQAGSLPRKWCIGIVNNSGGTLDATGGSHAVSFTGKTLNVA